MSTVLTRFSRRSTSFLATRPPYWAFGLTLLGCSSSDSAPPSTGGGSGGQSSETAPSGSSMGGKPAGSQAPGTGGTMANPSGAGSGGAAPAMGAGGRPSTGGGGAPGGIGGMGAGGAVAMGGSPGGMPDAAPRSADGAAPAKDGPAVPPGDLPKFSFFYTSLDSMRKLSGSQNGFGGDLRFPAGTGTGLEGADKICQTIATNVNAMFGLKTWRAFLSATKGPDGQPVHAIDRVGAGPWYDRNGRLIAMNKAGLVNGSNRPAGDPQAVNDMPDETGQGTKRLGDTHDVITGSNTMGRLRFTGLVNTCNDWTSLAPKGPIGMGHAWPAGSGMHWIQVHTEPSCGAGVNLVQNGGGNGSSIGAGGGWGGFYCFALTP